MNFGECPYCDDFIGPFTVPDKAPAFIKTECQHCNKTVWYRLSRIDPMAYTVKGFQDEYDFDEENGIITKKDTTP